MISLDTIQVLEKICALSQKWGLYIHISENDVKDFGEIFKAASFLNWDEHGQVIADGHGWFLFDTEEECYHAYWSCVGDDGPTPINDYSGKVRIYALTCNPEGQALNENT